MSLSHFSLFVFEKQAGNIFRTKTGLSIQVYQHVSKKKSVWELIESWKYLKQWKKSSHSLGQLVKNKKINFSLI